MSFVDKLLEATVPEQQGSMDALCGPYSIVNALNLLNIKGYDDTECFIQCVTAIKNKFPKAIWFGTYISDMEKMAEAVCHWAKKEYGAVIEWNRPFKDTDFKSPAEFFKELSAQLDDYSVATLGIDEPYQHWTVAWYTKGNELKFFDSDGLTLVRKNQISLDDKANKWTFATEETIIFRKLSD
jgi:hypothetical protein